MSHPSGTRPLRRLPGLSQLWQRLETLPMPEVEDSLLLRVLVQALVIIGIIGIDVAAETTNSVWAVPASIIGAAWSWYRRRDRNIAVKFCIAIGMLIALATFFVRLVGELNDTRLALAELLILLQVLHSFDLPRRKDLGYSMVIGLILLGVGGTLSQTIAFAPVLLVFLAIALPVLILDYRSRLGLAAFTLRKRLRKVSPAKVPLKQLGVFFLVVVGLGLTIFAFLPRFPGYQIRTFPVSSPVQFEGEFDNRRVLNPGYVRTPQEGTQNGGGAGQQGQGSGRGAGKLDDTFYYGFNTQINQNLRGQLTPKVVMRVRSQAEGFWRVLGFDRYNGQGWEISRNDQAATLDRPQWTYRFYVPTPLAFFRSREIVQTYTIVSELPNLIPVLTYPKELYFPTQQVALDAENGLRSPLTLIEGMTYTVISDVPYRDRSLLRKAPTTYSSQVRNFYLQVPDNILPRVRQRTEEILARSPNPLTDPYEKSLYLAQYLKQQYTVQPDLPFLGENDDLVEAFLFRFEGGYPDHFSTALTIMLRSVGIPARLVAGFAPGEFNPFTGLYVVRNTDAYAMTEVYFPNYGWFAFDPIPGHELIPPSIEENQTFTVLQHFWKWVAGWLPTPLTSGLGNVFEFVVDNLMRAIAWIISLFSRGWVGLFIGLVLALSLGFLSWLGWSGWREWQHRRWLAKLPPMEGLYQQMLNWLAVKGFRKRPAQTPLEYAQAAWEQRPPEQAQAINEISQAYVGWRYGGQSPNVQRLRRQFRDLKKVKQVKSVKR